jgi:hypothetical protein
MSRIAQVARWTDCDEVALVFESSQRADEGIEAAFQGLSLSEEEGPLRVRFFFMSKSAGEAGLEVAVFIVHAVSRQARNGAGRPSDFLPDFRAVFHGRDPREVSFVNVRCAELRPGG